MFLQIKQIHVGPAAINRRPNTIRNMGIVVKGRRSALFQINAEPFTVSTNNLVYGYMCIMTVLLLRETHL